MKNKFLKIRDNRGTALITAFLMMGVLVAVSLVLSMLVIREVKITKNFLSAGKAYYAAESGVEEALYHLENNLPGWEPANDLNEKDISAESKFKYILNNRCDSYPCTDDFDTDSVKGETNVDYAAFYDVLNLDENITIPMFIVEEGEIKSIKNFVVQYYANFDPQDDLRIDSSMDFTSAGWDVLRWKIFGMKKGAYKYSTESINDFSAVSPLSLTQNSNADSPSWFGTASCSGFSDRKVPGIECLTYPVDWNTTLNGGEDYPCQNTQARDYYQYSGDEVVAVDSCYDIFNFMDSHLRVDGIATGMNYLSLTNMMNPAMFNDDINMEDRLKKSKIYFRVEAYKDPSSIGSSVDNVTDEFVREYADITSDGYSGDAKQSVNVKIKRDSYMPVFNFAIYSTYGAKVGTDDDSYYSPDAYNSVDYF